MLVPCKPAKLLWVIKSNKVARLRLFGAIIHCSLLLYTWVLILVYGSLNTDLKSCGERVLIPLPFVAFPLNGLFYYYYFYVVQ